MMNSYRTILAVVVIAASACAFAQSAPPASRTAFKCKVNGKVVYSDEPCLGAERIDVEPSKRVNATPRRPASSDARRQQQPQQQPQQQREPQPEATEENSASTADVERTVEAQSGRGRLSSQSQRECHDLESAVAVLEREEKEASKAELPKVQSQLFAKRKRFADLGC